MPNSTKLVTTKDILIPAGTEVGPGPTVSTYLTAHGEILVGFDKNTTGSLRFDLEEAKALGLIEEVPPPIVVVEKQEEE